MVHGSRTRRHVTLGKRAPAASCAGAQRRWLALAFREKLLLRGWALLAGAGVGRTSGATALHPLRPLGLHFVPFLLLGRVKERANLRVAALVDLHHLAAAIRLGT